MFAIAIPNILSLQFLAVVQKAVTDSVISSETNTKTRKILQDNIDWLNKHEKSIENWLEDFYQSSGNKAATLSLCGLVVLVCFSFLTHF